MGYYDLIDIGYTGNGGLYRLNSEIWEERDGTQILGKPYNGEIEWGIRRNLSLVSKSVSALNELLAYIPTSDMAGFNIK